MTGRGAALAERWIRPALVGFTVILPLAVWPGAARAFSTIKLLGLVVPAAVVAAAGLRLLGRPRLPLAMDIGVIVSMASVAMSSIAGSYLLSHDRLATTGSRRRARVAVGVAMAVVLGLIAVASPAGRNPRPLARAIEGRLYIWKVAAGHLGEYVAVVLGPGSFVQVFPSWETADWEAGRFGQADRRFIGSQDHAHNEYLELLVEQGIVGPAGFLTILLAFFVFAARRAVKPASLVASAAGVMVLAGVAVVVLRRAGEVRAADRRHGRADQRRLFLPIWVAEVGREGGSGQARMQLRRRHLQHGQPDRHDENFAATTTAIALR